MLKEYSTIREVVGPLMMVEGVSGVKYDELVEIHQENGEVRMGRVLEIDGDRAMLQLFESSQGLKIDTAPSSFPFRRICWGECSTAWAGPRTAARRSFPKCAWT